MNAALLHAQRCINVRTYCRAPNADSTTASSIFRHTNSLHAVGMSNTCCWVYPLGHRHPDQNEYAIASIEPFTRLYHKAHRGPWYANHNQHQTNQPKAANRRTASSSKQHVTLRPDWLSHPGKWPIGICTAASMRHGHSMLRYQAHQVTSGQNSTVRRSHTAPPLLLAASAAAAAS